MRGSRKFCQRESNFDNDFFFNLKFMSMMRGERAQRVIIGQSAFRWRAYDDPTLNAGLAAL